MPLSELSAAWQRRLGELCRMAGVRSIVRAGETAVVVVPLVVGWLKPVILLPLGVLAQLPAEQVEAILLHELAHIRRHDFLVNLLQSVVETLFFYHPAVRSISRRIREERELVCDDLSVEWCRNPVVYAEALTTFEEFRRQSLALAATGEGDLLARVRRIVLGVEPRQHTASLIAVAGFLGTGIYLASMFLAPLLAAQIMTDQERVAAIETLHPPGADTMSNDRPSPQIRLSGTLTTEDGQPVPKSLLESFRDPKIPSEAVLLSRYGNGSMTSSLYFSGNSVYGNPAAGAVSLAIWAQSYAPLVLDHLEIKNNKIGPLSLVLRRGFPAQLRLVGPDNKPLQGVKLSASTLAMTRFPNVAMPDVYTDQKGGAMIGNVDAKTVLTIRAAKPGWQMTDRTIGDWLPDHVVSWTLQPATLTSGTIVDAISHLPLAGADILLASQSGAGSSAPSTYSPDNAPVLGHGDNHGNFQLDNLNPDYSYNVYVKAPGYPFTVVPIQPGDQGTRLALHRGLRISGRVLDPKGLLKNAYPPVQIRCDISISPNPQYGTSYTLYQKFPKLGPVLPFSFGDLPSKNEVSAQFFSPSAQFLVNGNWYTVPLEHNVDDFVIDLSKSPPKVESQPPLPSRAVEITLTAGKDGPVPVGNLNVLYYWKGNDPKVRSFLVQKSIPLVNGKATAQFPTPNQLTPNPSGLVGYWFKEQVFDLSAGTGASIKTIEVIPAGAIHGKVTAEADLRDKLFTCSAILIKAPPGLDKMNLGLDYVPLQGAGRYLTVPLPLGGIYSVLLQQGSSTYTVSPPITIDSEHPIVGCDLHEEADNAIRGKFVDASNKPISLESVTLTYHPTSLCFFSNVATRTARDGTFTIPNVNFDVPGYYDLQLDSTNWTQNEMHLDGQTAQPLTLVARHK
jgi:hypothetical protein